MSARNALHTVVYRKVAPAIIRTDNGLEFKNQLLNRFLAQHHIRHEFCRPRNPQNQCQIERCNQKLVSKLAKCLSNCTIKHWIDRLEEIAFQYNCN